MSNNNTKAGLYKVHTHEMEEAVQEEAPLVFYLLVAAT